MNKIYKIYSIKYYDFGDGIYIWDGYNLQTNRISGGTVDQKEINRIILNSINPDKYKKHYKNLNQLSLEL